MFGRLIARLDPAGEALAAELEQRIAQLSWGQVAWLIERGPHQFMLPADGGRAVTVRAEWDMEPWASDTYVWLRVQAVIAGRPRDFRFAHRALAQHWGDTLPERRQPSEPVDLPSLLT